MALSKERLLKVYRDMVMIRRFEEVIRSMLQTERFPDSYICPLARKRVRQVWWTP